MKEIIRSPFFYVGDKYKLMPQLKKLMPDQIETYIEPFCGGGSSFLNTNGKKYLLNDVDPYVIKLHKNLSKYKNKPDILFEELFVLIDKYGLSCSYKGITVSDEMKKEYVKTYYAHYNKAGYNKMREDFNNDQNNMILLYLLLIYGFNHMIRFNLSGKFNLPVGNVDFNNNVYTALYNYLKFIDEFDARFYSKDYQQFLNSIEISEKDFLYLDPPYLISGSEYNKLWNDTSEEAMCEYLDKLNNSGIRWGITNLIYHKGRENETFHKWCQKYIVYDIKSNYISFNDNTIKKESKEVYVTNYGRK